MEGTAKSVPFLRLWPVIRDQFSCPERPLFSPKKTHSLAACLLYREVRFTTGSLPMMRLLESKPEKKGRSAGGTIFSIILHSLIIFLAIFATARAGTRKTENRETKVNFVSVKKD